MTRSGNLISYVEMISGLSVSLGDVSSRIEGIHVERHFVCEKIRDLTYLCVAKNCSSSNLLNQIIINSSDSPCGCLSIPEGLRSTIIRSLWTLLIPLQSRPLILELARACGGAHK